MSDLIERLRRTKTERLMRPAFGGIMLDMEDEREVAVNPDGPAAAEEILRLRAKITELTTQPDNGEGR